MKIDWKRKLTSRKFWACVASFVFMLLIYFKFSETEASQVAALIMAGGSVIAYIIGEGLADSSNSIIQLEPQFGEFESEDDENKEEV